MGIHIPAAASGANLAPLSALYVASAGTNYVGTPDAAAYDGLTELELVAHVQLDNYSTGAMQLFTASRATSNWRWAWGISTTSQLFVQLSIDGTTIVLSDTTATTVGLGLTAGTAYWFRCTWNSVTGTVTFGYAPDQADEPTTWTDVPTPDAGPTAALFSGTGDVSACSWFGGTPAIGKHYRHIGRGAIGGADLFHLDLRNAFGSRFRDEAGRIWTLNGTGWAWAGKA